MFSRTESRITEKASRETGALTFFPKGRTYSPPTQSAVYPGGGVRSTRFCFGTSHRNGKFALAAQHRHFHLAVKNGKYCTHITIVTQERK